MADITLSEVKIKQQPYVKPPYREPKEVIEFITKLVPNEEERELLLDFMAYTIQNPGTRIHWALVLLGTQGSGKTTIFHIMEAALGPNAKSVDGEEFCSNFNGYAEGSQFSFVEEIKIEGLQKYAILNRVKSIITNNVISVTRKGKDAKTVRNVTNYMMGTNFVDAIPLTEEDRRYAVIQTLKCCTPRDFEKVWWVINNQAEFILQWLKEYKISRNFRPKENAPKTPSTLQMIRNTSDVLAEHIEMALDDSTPLCNRGLISFSVLRDRLIADNTIDQMMIMDKRFSTRLGKKLLQMNYTNAPQKSHRIGKNRHSLYIPDINLCQRLDVSQEHYLQLLEAARANPNEQ